MGEGVTVLAKQKLTDIFSNLTQNTAWTMQLVKIVQSAKIGTHYMCREIRLLPSSKGISDYYTSQNGIPSYAAIDDYTGDVVEKVIYKIKSTNPVITTEYKAFINASGDPDIEIDIDQFKASAAAFVGTVKINGHSTPAHLISIRKPVTLLTNKYLLSENGCFKEVNHPILTVPKTIDVAIFGNEVFLFSQAGEKLFNMERSYRKVCKNTVDDIVRTGLLSNNDTFAAFAKKGINPRRFISYNGSRLDWLQDVRNREKAARKFGFRLDGRCRIITEEEIDVESLVKFLCNKAMIDPCNEYPVEVYSAKPWGK